MANIDTLTVLYDGIYSILFKNSSHRYYVNGVQTTGVTTILSKVLAKPELMLWPLNMAVKYIRDNCPRPADSYLVNDLDLAEAADAHVKRRDAGASTGTEVHAIAEQALLTGVLSYSGPSIEIALAVRGFEKWLYRTNPEVIAVENVVYSQVLDYVGTFDSILKIDGKVYLCDLKTTNASRTAPKGVYAENFIQLGAYYLAYNEQREYELRTLGRTNLVAIDDLMIISCRKDGHVDTVSASDVGLSIGDCARLWDAVLLLERGLSKLKKKLEGK